jgi:Gly-Xaa carboxypeptidase
MSKGAIYLPTSSHPADRQRSNKTRWSLALLGVLFSAGFLFSCFSPLTGTEEVVTVEDAQAALKGSACYQPEPRMPKGYNTSVILGEKDRIVNWLSEAVKIPTEVFDVMGPVDEDPKWQVMPPFHDCELIYILSC